MAVRIHGKGWKLDVTWPDGSRNQVQMPDEDLARLWDDRIRLSKRMGEHDWRRVREDLLRRIEKELLFRELTGKYETDYVSKSNRDKKTKASRIKTLVKAFGSKPTGSISGQDVARYRSRRQKDVTNATVNREVSVLRHVFAWAIENGFAIENPAASVAKLKEVRNRTVSRKGIPRPRRVQTAHVEAVLKEIGKKRPDILPLFQFIAATGCRKGEAMLAKHEHIDFEERLVVIIMPKPDEENVYPLTQEVEAAIRAVPQLPGCPFVFWSGRSGTRWRNIDKIWRNARTVAKLEWMEIHDLRRYRATALWETSGLSPQQVAALLGHASPDVTSEHYVQSRKRDLAKLALKVIEGVG